MCLKKIFPRQGRFYKDTNKRYLRKVRLYPPFLYFALDAWLEEMSRKGWHIVDCGLVTYLFEKGSPQEKIYFTYLAGSSARKDSGYFSISLRYPLLERSYGVKRQHSIINANNSRTHRIVEIDTKKININNDVGFYELYKERNKLHALQAFRDIVVAAIIVMVFVGYWLSMHH